MIKLRKEQAKCLLENYGEPMLLNTAGKTKGVNEQFFAAYIALKKSVLYNSIEKTFYLYSKKTGAWDSISEDKLLNKIGIELRKYGNRNNIIEINGFLKALLFKSILTLLKGLIENNTAFSQRKQCYYHCKNGMLVFDESSQKWEFKEFSPKYYSLYRSPYKYDKDAKCPEFISKLLENAVTPTSIKLLQMYFGQILMGKNSSQTFLLLIGTPGGGKSTLVNIIEKIIGRQNCAELRLEQMTGRFEISSVMGKTLLTGKDVSSEFMNGPGARALKVLTGNDTVTVEYKNKNTRHSVAGNFNVIITSNNLLRIKFDGDIGAWRRRMLVIRYDNPAPKKAIPGFDDKLLAEEHSGIINWMLEGSMELANNNNIIPKNSEQISLVEKLLSSSQPFEIFGDNFIHSEAGAAITTQEVVTLFTAFCEENNWPIISERKAQLMFHEYMRKTHRATLRTDIKLNGKNKRGYYNYQLRSRE